MLTVRHDIKLSMYPLLCGFGATGAASLRLAALTDDLSVRAVRCSAIVVFGTHHIGAACEHAFHASDLPKAEGLSMFPQNLLPSVVLCEQEFCCPWDKLFRGMSATSFTPSVLSQVRT